MFKQTQIHAQFSILEIQSNKLYKMRYNLLEAKRKGSDTIVTYGGAFSNHIAATAAFGKEQGFKTVGIIRGDELGNDLEKTLATNPTLRLAAQNGMHFEFVSREMYRNKHNKNFLQRFGNSFGNYYEIPEGGTNALAVKGCQEILNQQTKKFDIICVPVGTGGTISGIINTAERYQKIIGFPALKGDFLENEIATYTNNQSAWFLQLDYHFGGFAKVTDDLITFINAFKQQYKVLLDPIYNAKMVFGIQDLFSKGYFNDKKVLAIHTGGIQGIQGINQQLLKKK